MPVSYIEEDTEEILTGHFAFIDGDGCPHVWADGGTSYTRVFAPEDERTFLETAVVRCRAVFPLAEHSHTIQKRNVFLGGHARGIRPNSEKQFA